MTAAVEERRTPGFRRRVEHPDDLSNLHSVLDRLVALRRELHVDARGMAVALGVTQDAVEVFYTRRRPRLDLLQRHAAVLGGRLTVTLNGLVGGDDPYITALRAMARDGGPMADQFETDAALARMVAARKTRCSGYAWGRLPDMVGERSLRKLEAGIAAPYALTWYRHARDLGGHMTLAVDVTS